MKVATTNPNFYPRSPRGERRGARTIWTERTRFLSTLPARGATKEPPLTRQQNKISIHAPREGSDKRGSKRGGKRAYFYPRSPRGERLQLTGTGGVLKTFLSTLPARGATTAAEVVVL